MTEVECLQTPANIEHKDGSDLVTVEFTDDDPTKDVADDLANQLDLSDNFRIVS